jgi:hypothetical protein
VLQRRLHDVSLTWFETARVKAREGTDADLLQIYTGATRRAGSAMLALTTAEIAQPAAASSGLIFDRWSIDDAVRAVLLLDRAAATSDPDACAVAAVLCYEQGDAREQQSWTRAVSLLPKPEQYAALVIDICRTNILPLFEAVACDNPYPARYFPDRNFNQVVLKALFNSVPLGRIVGFASRRNAELVRMAGDYKREREAAGRTVPADICMALELPQ